MMYGTYDREPIALSWSGGKDSALALHALQQSGAYEVVALLTTLADAYARISHHGVREELLDAQAAAIGGPRLDKVYLPVGGDGGGCTNEQYEDVMREAMLAYREAGITRVAFGDIFLDDLRAYREARLAEAGMEAVFPLWMSDTADLARQFINEDFKAYLSCVDARKLDASFAGRSFDHGLLRDLADVELPAPGDCESQPCCFSLSDPHGQGVDPCGEYGEFHSFVYDGPIFRRPVDVSVAQTVHIGDRYFAELLPAAHAHAAV